MDSMGEKPLTADEKHRIWLHQPKECLPEQRLCEQNLLPLEEPTLPKEGVLKREPLLTRIGTPLSQEEYDMRKDADQKLLAQDPEKVLIETGGVLPRLTTADGQHALASMVPCKEIKGGCPEEKKKTGDEKGPVDERTRTEKALEQFVLLVGAVNLQLDEDLKRPDGKKHGIVGGRNPDGFDNPVAQLAAAILQLTPLAQGQIEKFIEKFNAAAEKKAIAVYTESELGKEAVEHLAEMDIVLQRLHEKGYIGPYKWWAKFTAGHKAEYQAHHIVEKQWFDKKLMTGDPDLVPSVILGSKEHTALNTELAHAIAEARKRNPKMDHDALWKIYQDVYQKYPHWLAAIKSYFPNAK